MGEGNTTQHYTANAARQARLADAVEQTRVLSSADQIKAGIPDSADLIETRVNNANERYNVHFLTSDEARQLDRPSLAGWLSFYHDLTIYNKCM